MSTASLVPETFELTGDDAWETISHTGRRQLLRDAFFRLRVADGFSHARSLAYVTSLVMIQGIIALVGLASALGRSGANQDVAGWLATAVPGPGGELLRRAVEQAQDAGSSQQYLGLTFGLVGALITGTTMMGQMERGLNRIYGVEQDRPTIHKYGRALVLAVTAGACATVAFATLAFGRGVGDSIADDTLSSVWMIARWPLALLAMVAAIALVFRWSPRRHQPAWSWLTFGAAVSVALWWMVTLGLSAFFRVSSSFGETYGPLAGLVALLLWSLLSSIAVLYGGAVAAQLEAVRAGAPRPQDGEKVSESEPLGDERLARVAG